ADARKGAVPVPMADAGTAAGAHALLLRLAATIPRPVWPVDHPAGLAAAGGAVYVGLAIARSSTAVRVGRAVVLHRPLRHQQRGLLGTSLRTSQPLSVDRHRAGCRRPAGLGRQPPAAARPARHRRLLAAVGRTPQR